MASEVKPFAPTTGVATTASDVRPLLPTIGVKRTAGLFRPAAGTIGVEKTASEVRPLAPTTGDGTTARAVLPLAMVIGAGIGAAGWLAAGLCSADDPTARVTAGPAICSTDRAGMIVAPISPVVGLPAGLASIMTPLSDMVELGAPMTVGKGMTEASVTPANPTAEVANAPALSAKVVACRLDDPPSGDIVTTRGGITVPPTSVRVGELDSTVSLGRPLTEEMEEPTIAT